MTLVPNVGCTIDREVSRKVNNYKGVKTPWEYLKLYVVKPQELGGSRGDRISGDSLGQIWTRRIHVRTQSRMTDDRYQVQMCRNVMAGSRTEDRRTFQNKSSEGHYQ